MEKIANHRRRPGVWHAYSASRWHPDPHPYYIHPPVGAGQADIIKTITGLAVPLRDSIVR